MTQYAEFLASEPTIEVLGQDVVRDAQRFTYRTKQHGIVFNIVRPLEDAWSAEWVEGIVDGIAGILVGIGNLPHVVGVQTTQEVDVLNQIHDGYLIGVESTSGESSRILHWDALPFDFSYAEQAISAAVAEMDAFEGR